MRFSICSHFTAIALFVAMLSLSGGCGKDATKSGAGETKVAAVADDHSGWWCPEHGVPEEVCSMCSSKAAADFKDKGDWCAEHNRAKSQCFKCDPKLAEKFAKLYVAKYGTQPPAAAK